MAEGLAKKYMKNCIIKSAGTHPEPINPFAIEVMKEIDIDLSNHHSKSISDKEMQNIDIVITLCGDAKEQCVILNNSLKKKIHWNINDPAKASGNNEKLLTIFRKTRDHIEKEIKSLIGDLN